MKMKTGNLIYALLLMGFVFIFSDSCKKDDDNNSSNTVTDVDGNVYHTKKIGKQTWMVENLKTTHYSDASKTPIPFASDNTAWIGLTADGYCWYDNDVSNKATYGALYNGDAASNIDLCPTGWHMPTKVEWDTLVSYLKGDSVAGGKLKESGTAHWLSPNTGANNSSGFTALPGGSHYTNGSFYLKGKYGWYWSSTESSATETWHVYMQYNNSFISGTDGSKKLGFSVRCVKD